MAAPPEVEPPVLPEPLVGLPLTILQSSAVPLASHSLGSGALSRMVSWPAALRVGLAQPARVSGLTVLALPGMCWVCSRPPRTRPRGMGE